MARPPKTLTVTSLTTLARVEAAHDELVAMSQRLEALATELQVAFEQQPPHDIAASTLGLLEVAGEIRSARHRLNGAVTEANSVIVRERGLQLIQEARSA